MTVNIKITAPVYQISRFGTFERRTDIQISGDFDSFSGGYIFLRTQIDELLKESNAENTLLLNLHDLEREISNKKKAFDLLDRQVKTAENQLHRLQSFLERLGIDSSSYFLSIADWPIASPVAVEAEVDSNLFDSADSDKDSHEL